MRTLSATRSNAARITSGDGAVRTTSRAHSPSGSRERAMPRRSTRSTASAAESGCASGSSTRPRSGAYALAKVSAMACGNAAPKRWSGRGSGVVSMGVNGRTRSRGLLRRSSSLELEEYCPPCVGDHADPLAILRDDEIHDLADRRENVGRAVPRGESDQLVGAVEHHRPYPDRQPAAIDERLGPLRRALGRDRAERLRVEQVERAVAPELDVTHDTADLRERLRRIERLHREPVRALVRDDRAEGTGGID